MSQKFVYLRQQFLTWFFANILGFGALGASIPVFTALIPVSGFVATILVIAFPISIAQWIALRRILQTSILWIFTIPIGILLAALIIRVIPGGLWPGTDDESIANLTFIYLVVGFSIGLLQWFVLRRQLRRSSIWLLASSIAVAVSFWLILVTGLINRSGVVSYIVGALVYAIITGLFLSGLLAHHTQSQVDQVNAT
jgi:hypothetical protein